MADTPNQNTAPSVAKAMEGKPVEPSFAKATEGKPNAKATEGKPKRGFAGWWQKTTGEPLKLRDKIVLVVFAVVFLFVFYVSLDANKYPALVRVIAGEGAVGVNPTDRALDFGDLAQGTSAVRRVDIQNGTFMPVYVLVWETGSIAELMDVDKKAFRLGAHEGTKIEFSTYIPASAAVESKFNGRVYLFKIPTFGL